MNRACSRSRLRNPLAFTPLNLFSIGEQGAWFDPSDMATLFQDDAGTVPVTAADQVVGRMLDKSGNANHASQSTEASKPILRNSGTLWWLEFDGVDDFMLTTAISFVSTDEISIFAGVRKTSDAAVAIVAELSVDSNTQNGAFFLAAPGANATPNFAYRSNGTVRPASSAITLAAPATAVLTGLSDISAPSQLIRSNGINGIMVATSQGTGNYGNYPLYIGRRGGATLPFLGNLYGLIARGVLTGAASLSATEKYMASKAGITL